MGSARHSAAAGAIDGLIYVVGGFNSDPFNSGALDSLEVFDPADCTWSNLAPMPAARTDLAVGVIDGKLYVVGPSGVATLGIYDPWTDTWTTGADMPTPRTAPAVSVIDGKLYAVGGFPGRDVLEVYDPLTDSWQALAPMPTPLTLHAAAAVDGKLYVPGGATDGGSVSSLLVYDPSTDTWSFAASMPETRSRHSVQAVGDSVYVFGGGSGQRGKRQTRRVLAYDTRTDTWSDKAWMPSARNRMASAASGGKIFALGGLSPKVLGSRPIVDVYEGEACDVESDSDRDGLPDSLEAECACETFRNHGAFMRCLGVWLDRMEEEGCLDPRDRSDVHSQGARSDCGR